MNVFKRVATALNSTAWDQMIRDWQAGKESDGSEGIPVTQDTAMKYSAVFGCCRVLAETFCSVVVKEYKRTDRSGDRQRTYDTSAYDILHNVPNDEMNPFSFSELGMYQLNLGGNFMSRKIRNNAGGIHSLIPLNHECVEIKRNENTKRVEYVFKPNNEKEETYTRDQVFHVPGPSLNGITGMNPISYARAAIKLGKTYEMFLQQYYENGALPSGMFEHPGTLKDIAYDRLKADLEKGYKSFLNKGKPLVLEDGLKYSPFSLDLLDAQLLESKKFQIEDICRIYRVPLHMVQNLDKATNNNIEHQSLEFAMYTMLPWFKRWESCVNAQLLSKAERQAGYYLEYDMASLLRGDSKSMAEAFARGRQWGWLSVNDIRRLLNMNSIPNGDIYLQPVNMVEAGASGLAPVDQKLVDEIRALIETRKE